MKTKSIWPIKIIFLFTFILLVSISIVHAQESVVEVKVNIAKTFQAIDNFGASDAWSCQFVGNWPDNKRNKMADLLFSLKTYADGSPKGIGLSLWRFNLGAGSAAQGEQSGIRDLWRRGASFLTPEGHYNWQAASGQQWFLKAAHKRGVKKFLAFSNSPPVQFTRNGKAFSSDGRANLDSGRFRDFGNYLADVIKGIARMTHVTINYISPVNEPQWDWMDGGQEGDPYTNSQMAKLVRSINTSIESAGLKTKILVGEAGKIDYLFKTGDKPGKGNQINDFFRKGSENYIADLPAVDNVISAHSYFTTSPQSSATALRRKLHEHVAAVKGLAYWQSEYCILGDNNGEIDGNKRDLSMNAALYLASVIHVDLTMANAAAWQWWTAISAYDYKDGLIYVDKNKKDGQFYPSKMLWVLGNFSRFVRPGAIRVEADAPHLDSATEKKQLLVSAFKKGKEFTAVLINPDVKALKVRLNFGSQHVQLRKGYLTSASASLRAIKISAADMTIPAKSVLTLTGLIH